MKYKILLSLLVIMLGTFLSTNFSCRSVQTEMQKEDQMLAKCWTHSHEENVDGMQVYRPCDFKEFGPSRYRAVYNLNANKTCAFSVLARNDKHTSDQGKWNFDKARNTLIIKDSQGEILKELLIVKLEIEKLLVK